MRELKIAEGYADPIVEDPPVTPKQHHTQTTSVDGVMVIWCPFGVYLVSILIVQQRELWGLERNYRNAQKPIFMRVSAHVTVSAQVSESRGRRIPQSKILWPTDALLHGYLWDYWNCVVPLVTIL